MKLTPEQNERIAQAKARGDRRLNVQFSPEQRQAYFDAVELELASKEENIAHFRKLKAAAEQSGFFGDVRRAILLSRSPIPELASTIGVEWRLLSDFQAGEAEIPAAALDRLLDQLGLRLMQEIPR
jgi:hypothetical protein